MVCLALELVGPWVVLGFSVGMEAFDELLSINVPWSQEPFPVLVFRTNCHFKLFKHGITPLNTKLPVLGM